MVACCLTDMWWWILVCWLDSTSIPPEETKTKTKKQKSKKQNKTNQDFS